MHKDRVVELRRVRAGDLVPAPLNWRKHPQAQQDAMRGILNEIGYADAVLARDTDNGLELIDGHLRASLDDDQVVPVLILDLNNDEAKKLLLTLDPLAAMAETDLDALTDLLDDVTFNNESLIAMLDALALDGREIPDDADHGSIIEEYKESFSVMVLCQDEAAQGALLVELNDRGYDVRALTG